MRTERIAVRHPAAEGAATSLALRELTGRDELAIEGIDTRAAVALLDRLLGDAAAALELAAPDRDRLLAALHRREWGDRIITTVKCAACGAPFDLSFNLSDVETHLSREADADGPRPPTAREELDAASTGARNGVLALAHQLGIDAGDIESACSALEKSAPILDLEISAACFECGHEQQAHFDVQSFVLQRLLGERNGLLGEIHLLAASYGWSLREIASLPRSTRRAMANALDQARLRRR